jgi:hypothetical protein
VILQITTARNNLFESQKGILQENLHINSGHTLHQIPLTSGGLQSNTGELSSQVAGLIKMGIN